MTHASSNLHLRFGSALFGFREDPLEFDRGIGWRGGWRRFLFTFRVGSVRFREDPLEVDRGIGWRGVWRRFLFTFRVGSVRFREDPLEFDRGIGWRGVWRRFLGSAWRIHHRRDHLVSFVRGSGWGSTGLPGWPLP